MYAFFTARFNVDTVWIPCGYARVVGDVCVCVVLYISVVLYLFLLYFTNLFSPLTLTHLCSCPFPSKRDSLTLKTLKTLGVLRRSLCGGRHAKDGLYRRCRSCPFLWAVPVAPGNSKEHLDCGRSASDSFARQAKVCHCSSHDSTHAERSQGAGSQLGSATRSHFASRSLSRSFGNSCSHASSSATSAAAAAATTPATAATSSPSTHSATPSPTAAATASTTCCPFQPLHHATGPLHHDSN